jgi:putative ABC transport system permease protein
VGFIKSGNKIKSILKNGVNMVPVAWRLIWKDKSRFFITVGGIGFTVLLILFLFGVYEGVKIGATSYVANNNADIWICQKNSTNLLRSSSFLSTKLENDIKNVNGVSKTSPILRVLATAEINDKKVTMFIFGYKPDIELGKPPFLENGSTHIKSGEIILDKAFAAKHNFSIGNSLLIQGQKFKVAGISSETNAIVAQFAFTTLQDAQNLIDLPQVCSFYLIKNHPDIGSDLVIKELQNRFPNLAIFSGEEFTSNNLEEMQAGVLPVLWTIAILGTFTGIAVIALMLYSSVLEKKEDYALLKAIGASQRYINFLVIKQSLFGAIFGFFLGLVVNSISSPLISELVPEISLFLTGISVGSVFIISILICSLGSLIPIQKLAKIYPGEVFRA